MVASASAVLRSTGGPLRIEDLAVDAPGPGEVLVRTVAAGVCHTDLHVMTGALPLPPPVVVGHESAGVVETVGPGVAYVRPGDHVVTCSSLFCGACEYCLTGRMSLCRRTGMTRPATAVPRLRDSAGGSVTAASNLGCFAAYQLVHEHSVVRIDDRMPWDVAAVLGCSVTTGMGAVHNTARVELGSTVAVIGCGGVGLIAVQAAVQAGARRVIAVDLLPAHLEHAGKLGATDLVDASAGDPVDAVLALTQGGVEHAFEVVGRPDTIAQAFGMLRPGGAATVVGVVAPGVTVQLPAYAFLQGRTVRGSATGSNRFRLDIPAYVELYLQGRLDLDHLVSRRIPFAEVNDALGALRDGSPGRTVLEFDVRGQTVVEGESAHVR
jgi:S-(hydroxymethyl)glutathione dehydrogenase/alcohol dehydrogenase